MPIPEPLLQVLREIDASSTFSGSLPRISASSGKAYFAKIGTPKDTEQWAGEAESLTIMDEAAPGLVPRLLAFTITETGKPFFVSQYKDIRPLSSKAANELAKRLATELHTGISSQGFGFGIPTYCGATRLANGWFSRWDECFSSMIGDLLAQFQAHDSHSDLWEKGKTIQKMVIPMLLGSLEVKPVILHGDLWSGNAGMDESTGDPVIYDPASYYGHHEADLSIAKMFGGFPSTFFTTYHEYMPKTEPVEEYDLRMDLYQLFHYLNHTLLFGGSYASSAHRKMDALLLAVS